MMARYTYPLGFNRNRGILIVQTPDPLTAEVLAHAFVQGLADPQPPPRLGRRSHPAHPVPLQALDLDAGAKPDQAGVGALCQIASQASQG